MPSARRTGVTLLELLAVVTILGVIALIIIPRVTTTAATSRERACNQNRSEINGAVERYYFETGVWPPDIETVGALPHFPEGVPPCPVSGAAYTLDPSTHRVVGHTGGSH